MVNFSYDPLVTLINLREQGNIVKYDLKSDYRLSKKLVLFTLMKAL